MSTEVCSDGASKKAYDGEEDDASDDEGEYRYCEDEDDEDYHTDFCDNADDHTALRFRSEPGETTDEALPEDLATAPQKPTRIRHDSDQHSSGRIRTNAMQYGQGRPTRWTMIDGRWRRQSDEHDEHVNNDNEEDEN